MIVITLTDCPPALRGDLSKWLLEINTGVYVGQVSARVRDKLWERITANIKHGKASMVFDATNEQGMDFRIHNTSWEIVDCDGLQLVRRHSEIRMSEQAAAAQTPSTGTSMAALHRRLNRIAGAQSKKAGMERVARKQHVADFTVLDLETTGLNPEQDAIIEMAALRIRAFEAKESFNVLVQPDRPLPSEISSLTGLTEEDLKERGLVLKEALQQLLTFIGKDTLLIHNATFDLCFLKEHLARQSLPALNNRTLDTCMLARKAFLKLPDYRLSTLANYFGIDQPAQHRALADCQTAWMVYRAYTQSE